MHLLIIKDRQPLKVFLDGKKKMVLGRDKDADIRCNDNAISRRHLMLQLKGEQLYIEDLVSRNGFKVDDQKQEAALLPHNGKFVIGKIGFIFQTHADDSVMPGKLLHDNIVPITHSGEVKEVQEIATPVEEASNNMPMIIGGAIALLAVIGIGAYAMSGGEKPVVIESTRRIIDKSACLDSINMSVMYFNNYMNDKFNNSDELDKAITQIKQASAAANSKDYRAVTDIRRLYSLFKLIDGKWEDFSQSELVSINAIAGLIDEYKSNRTSPEIIVLSQRMSVWSLEQNQVYLNIIDLKKQLGMIDIKTLGKALEKCRQLNKSKHIYLNKTQPLEKDITVKLARMHYNQFKNLTKRVERSFHIEKAKEYDPKKYQSHYDDFNNKVQKTEANNILYLQCLKLVEDNNCEEVIVKLPKLFGTEHEAWAKTAIKNCKIHVLIRKIELHYANQEITRLDILVKKTPLKTNDKVMALMVKIHNVLSHLDDAKKSLIHERYREAQHSLEELMKAETNTNNPYYREASKLLNNELDSKKIPATHLARALKLFTVDCNLKRYKKVRDDLNIAEKHNPGCTGEYVKRQARTAMKELRAFRKVAYPSDGSKVDKEDFKYHFERIKYCLSFLNGDSVYDEEKKAFHYITTEVEK